jgi:uncharacterized membrane-anchored protein YhcB (DUF1043 family)
MDVASWQAIALGGGLLVAGILIGLVAARFGSGPRARVRALETELRAEQARNAEYREAVAQHFSEASGKFRDLTREYTALYEHLAHGARDLCPDRLQALGHAFDEPPVQPSLPLRIGNEPPAPAPSEPHAGAEEPAAPDGHADAPREQG